MIAIPLDSLNPSEVRRIRERAFTLIEMLITITIVAALAALIFPMSGKILREAKKTKSLGNLRSIGQAISLYTSDNQGRFPSLCSSDWESSFWSTTIDPYLPAAKASLLDPNGHLFSINAALADPLVDNGRHCTLGDYGGNPEVFFGPMWPNLMASLTLSSLPPGRTSKLVIFTPCQGGTLSPPQASWYFQVFSVANSDPSAWSGAGYPSDRGLGAYLCLFADYHTEIVPKNVIVQNRRDLFLTNP